MSNGLNIDHQDALMALGAFGTQGEMEEFISEYEAFLDDLYEEHQYRSLAEMVGMELRDGVDF
jgi:hypothetical protein